MDFGGVVVITSFVVVILWLLGTIFASDGLTYYGEGTVAAWLIFLAGILFLDDIYLKLSFWFSLPISLSMVFLADPYLVARTLKYGHDDGSFLRKRIRATPIWMALLWWVAATQMTYFCLRLDEIQAFFGIEMHNFWFAIIALFGGYFLPFEILVCNFTVWWKRRNCKEVFGVAIYAMIAETATVAAIYAFSRFLTSNVEQPIWHSISIGSVAALFIATAFIFSCFVFYRKT